MHIEVIIAPRHGIPASTAHPIEARPGTEVRFPVNSGRHNTRARKEVCPR